MIAKRRRLFFVPLCLAFCLLPLVMCHISLPSPCAFALCLCPVPLPLWYTVFNRHDWSSKVAQIALAHLWKHKGLAVMVLCLKKADLLCVIVTCKIAKTITWRDNHVTDLQVDILLQGTEERTPVAMFCHYPHLLLRSVKSLQSTATANGWHSADHQLNGSTPDNHHHSSWLILVKSPKRWCHASHTSQPGTATLRLTGRAYLIFMCWYRCTPESLVWASRGPQGGWYWHARSYQACMHIYGVATERSSMTLNPLLKARPWHKSSFLSIFPHFILQCQLQWCPLPPSKNFCLSR